MPVSRRERVEARNAFPWFTWAQRVFDQLRVPSSLTSTLVFNPTAFDANGVATSALTFTARDAQGNLIAGYTPTVVLTNPTLDASHPFVSASPSDIASDGVESCTVTVQVMTLIDGTYYPVSGMPVTIAVSGTGNSITQPSARTNASGITTGSFTTTQASATKTVTATVNGLAVSETATVTTDGGYTPPAPGSPFYSTGYEGADLASLNANGFVWGGSTRATISTEDAVSPTRSLRMAYQAAVAGADSRTQQNFTLGQNLTEVWFEWQMKVPSNYTTRSGESPSNNKWFRIWGDDYNAGNKFGASTDYNASYDDNTRLRFEYIYKTYADGLIGFGPSGQQSPATSFGGAMKNTWTRVRLHLKMVTAAENDGVAELWFDNTKVIDFQSIPAKYDDLPYWNTGYILGAANSGFTDETVLYVDDFKVFDADPEWTF